MTSHARCTTLVSAIVGSRSAGNAFRPSTTVFLPVCGSESHDASPGSDAALTVPFEFTWPSSVSGTSLAVFGTSSIAANFVGSLLKT